MKEQRFNGVTWDTSDLTGCKQAFCILAREGVDLDTLNGLDFGGLDTSAVWDELNGE